VAVVLLRLHCIGLEKPAITVLAMNKREFIV
jgi:hypothetical protein